MRDKITDAFLRLGQGLKVTLIYGVVKSISPFSVLVGSSEVIVDYFIDEDDGVKIIPKLDSVVLLGLVDGSLDNAIVIKYGLIDNLKIDVTELEIKGGNESLKGVLNDLKDLLDKITNTAIAPNTNIKVGNPSIATDLTSLNNKIDNLLKN